MKNLFKFNFFLAASIVAFTVFSGCSNDDDPAPFIPGQEGFFVINEGLFGGGNASLSFFDKQTGEIENNVFFQANSEPLGDQAQSMTIVEDRGYIVVQNSNKIEVIDTDDFTSITTIDGSDGLESPRYLLAVSGSKAYISDWGPSGDRGSIKVLDLTTNEITKTVPMGFGPNRMLLLNNEVYVTHSGRFDNQTFVFTPDQTLSIIDTTTDEISDEIELGDNLNAIQVDNNGNVWVSGSGNTILNPDFSVDLDNTTPGFIAKISPDGQVVISELPLKASGPNNLEINPAADLLYFNYQGDIYTLNTTQDLTNINGAQISLFVDEENLFGFSIDPSTGELINGIAPSFTSDGSIKRYNASGNLVDSYVTGIGPNGATFK